MELKDGYKQSEVGVIPANWCLRRGCEITTLIGKGASPRWQGFDYTDSGMLFVTSENVRDGFLDVSKPKYLTLDFHAKLSRTQIQKFDILINLVGGSIGRSCQVLLDLGAANVNQAVAVFRVTPSVSSQYICHHLQFVETKKRILEMQVDAARQNISLSNLRNFLFVLPPLAEQEAIATVLSDADAWIESLEQLIAKKRQIKQGAMQELLTGKRRLPGFSGEWNIYRFDQLFNILRNGSNSRSELSEHGEVAYVHYGDIHTHYSAFLNPRTTETYIQRERVRTLPRLANGDLLMADASEDTAAIGKAVEIVDLNGCEAVAGLHTMLLRGSKSHLADGFKGYLQFMQEVRVALIRLATGVSVYGITKSGVRAIEVKIPDLPEQSAIASFLSDMDAEIAIIEIKLTKARQIKQGMMQELLTGKIRLI